MKWWRLAAEQHYAPAEVSLAGMYELGRGGVSQDYAEMLKWLRKAAAQGSIGAIHSLGDIFSLGLDEQRKNYIEAYYWYSLYARLQPSNSHVLQAWAEKYAGKFLTPEQKLEIEARVEKWAPVDGSSIGAN